MSINEVRSNLKNSSSKINFNELKLEIVKDLIILVSPDLNLLEVAEGCAKDDSASFKIWLENGLVKKPTYEQMLIWKAENKIFDCCLVKPFIFLQRPNLN